MNKRLLFSVLGASALVGFTACQNDDLMSNGADGTQTVTFSAQLPNALTRAIDYGSGSEATTLKYAVYNAGATAQGDSILMGSASISNFSCSVQIDLVKGQEYDIYFWADNGTQYPYTFNGNNVTVSYDNITANDDTRDAFFGKLTNFTASTATAKVPLTRPFAQLNIATTDYTDAIKNHTTITGVTVETKAYTNISFVGDGALSDEKTVTISALKAADSDDIIFPTGDFPILGNQYTYLSMNYLLSADTEEVKLTINTTNSSSIEATISSVPFQANYRTNIAGSFLTDKQKFEVTVTPGFAGKDSVIVWDGTSLAMPEIIETEEGISATISSAAQLAGFAALVNGTWSGDNVTRTNVDYTSMDLTLTDNIDLGGKEWTPIGTASKYYSGSFNGGGYTISNLKVTREVNNNVSANNSIGLFGWTSGEVFENVTLHNVDIQGTLHVGALLGYAYADKETITTCRNINLTGKVNIKGSCYVGGLVGRYVKNISKVVIDVEPGSKVESYHTTHWASYVGGVIGHTLNGEGLFSEIKSNIAVEGSSVHVGGISGIAYGGNVFEDCVVTGNVSKTGNPQELTAPFEEMFNFDKRTVGGIVGVWNNDNSADVTVHNCTFTGELSNTDGIYAGNLGLVGTAYNNKKEGHQLHLDYIVSTPQQLQLLSTAVADGNNFYQKEVKLGNHINLDGIDWMPIGTSASPYKGNFDGGNFIISNLNVTRGDTDSNTAENNCLGLFGVTEGGTLKNIHVKNVEVKGCLYIGAVAGLASSRFENITVSGDINILGGCYVGGMFGRCEYGFSAYDLTVDANEHSLVESYNTITWPSYGGGVIGWIAEYSRTIEKVNSNIDVKANQRHVGGISGVAQFSNIFDDCHSSGTVTLTNAEESTIGGIIGTWCNAAEGDVTVTNCTFTGKLVHPTLTEFENSGLVGSKFAPNSNAGNLILGN